MSLQPVFCLMGPTASGKTHLAMELIQQFPFEIISVDSAMVYRGMDIGTAKPSAAELISAPHRLIDICDPADPYSAGKFCRDVQIEISQIFQLKKIPLLVGGTMLYFHLLQNGLAELPSADPATRQMISQKANEVGWPMLHQQLKKIDPEIAEHIEPTDAQRIQRALEIYYSTQMLPSQLQMKIQKPDYRFINMIVAPQDREWLKKRIATRFEMMLKQGFVEEVEQLKKRNDLHLNLPSIRTVGYRQIWSYLDGEYTYDTMQERAIIATRQLAKRQFTWLRRWKEVVWFNSEDKDFKLNVFHYINDQLS